MSETSLLLPAADQGHHPETGSAPAASRSLDEKSTLCSPLSDLKHTGETSPECPQDPGSQPVAAAARLVRASVPASQAVDDAAGRHTVFHQSAPDRRSGERAQTPSTRLATETEQALSSGSSSKSTVFIARVPHSVFQNNPEKDRFRHFLQQFARLLELKLTYDPVRRHVNAFATYETDAEALAASEHLNGAEYEGAQMRAELASGDRTVCFACWGPVSVRALLEHIVLTEAERTALEADPSTASQTLLDERLVRWIVAPFGQVESVSEVIHKYPQGSKQYRVVFEQRDCALRAQEALAKLPGSLGFRAGSKKRLGEFGGLTGGYGPAQAAFTPSKTRPNSTANRQVAYNELWKPRFPSSRGRYPKAPLRQGHKGLQNDTGPPPVQTPGPASYGEAPSFPGTACNEDSYQDAIVDTSSGEGRGESEGNAANIQDEKPQPNSQVQPMLLPKATGGAPQQTALPPARSSFSVQSLESVVGIPSSEIPNTSPRVSVASKGADPGGRVPYNQAKADQRRQFVNTYPPEGIERAARAQMDSPVNAARQYGARQGEHPGQPESDISSTVWVGQLPYKVGHPAIRAIFSQYGTIERIEIRHRYDLRQSFGFVTFSEPQSAREAVERGHGTKHWDRAIQVRHKQKHPFGHPGQNPRASNQGQPRRHAVSLPASKDDEVHPVPAARSRRPPYGPNFGGPVPPTEQTIVPQMLPRQAGHPAGMIVQGHQQHGFNVVNPSVVAQFSGPPAELRNPFAAPWAQRPGIMPMPSSMMVPPVHGTPSHSTDSPAEYNDEGKVQEPPPVAFANAAPASGNSVEDNLWHESPDISRPDTAMQGHSSSDATSDSTPGEGTPPGPAMSSSAFSAVGAWQAGGPTQNDQHQWSMIAADPPTAFALGHPGASPGSPQMAACPGCPPPPGWYCTTIPTFVGQIAGATPYWAQQPLGYHGTYASRANHQQDSSCPPSTPVRNTDTTTESNQAQSYGSFSPAFPVPFKMFGEDHAVYGPGCHGVIDMPAFAADV